MRYIIYNVHKLNMNTKYKLAYYLRINLIMYKLICYYETLNHEA